MDFDVSVCARNVAYYPHRGGVRILIAHILCLGWCTVIP